MNRILRLVTWTATVLFTALLLKQGPFFRERVNLDLEIGAQSFTVPLIPFLLISVAALAIPALLFRWARLLLIPVLVGAAGWTFSTSSRLPWWFVGKKSGWSVKAPDAVAILIALLAILSYFAFNLMDELAAYRKSSEARGLAKAEIEADARRLALGHGAVVAAGLVVGSLVWGLYEGVVGNADWFAGIHGFSWTLLVLVSGLLVVVGVLLVIGGPRRKAKATAEQWQPVWEEHRGP